MYGYDASKRSAQTLFMHIAAFPECVRRSLPEPNRRSGNAVLCHATTAELLPVLRRRRSPKFFSLFAHKGGDRQWSEAELPVAGKGASLLYIGALVLKGAMMLVKAKAVHRFHVSLLLSIPVKPRRTLNY
jgi:hypothetical protein